MHHIWTVKILDNDEHDIGFQAEEDFEMADEND